MFNPAAALASVSYVALGAAVGIAEGCLQALINLTSTSTAHVVQSNPTQALDTCMGVLLPIVILGDSRVGKTCLCQHFVKRALPRSTSPTVVADLFIKEMEVGAQPIIVQLWDVGGRDAAATLAPRFFDSAAGAMLVYAAADPAAADSLAFWHAELARKAAFFSQPRFALVVFGMGGADEELGSQAALRCSGSLAPWRS
ncbi:hypothetical protein WJX81_002508 [Elliptochloris bilobata]|uniref:Uncharacterized protein n=1 Tax=Elliptochloris bilobata TaxID=381761 RepID=A0AAW1QZ69_9CHLO